MIQEFVDYLSHNKGYSELTCFEYRKDLERFVKWLKSHRIERWSQVTKDTIDLYVHDMSEDGLKPATIKRRVATIRSLYQFAWIKGLTTENPAKYVSSPKMAMQLPKIIPTEELSATITDGTINIHTRAMIAVIAETGLRISEVLNLTMMDVDKTNRSIKVMGKGAKERIVYYGDMSAAYFDYVRVIGSLPIWNMTEREARFKVWEALKGHSNAKQLSPHAIRHSFATTMLNNGAPITTIQALLGHETVKTTERYAKVAQTTVQSNYKQFKPRFSNGRREEAKAVC